MPCLFRFNLIFLDLLRFFDEYYYRDVVVKIVLILLVTAAHFKIFFTLKFRKKLKLFYYYTKLSRFILTLTVVILNLGLSI